VPASVFCESREVSSERLIDINGLSALCIQLSTESKG
jgi:hypothetical protein